MNTELNTQEFDPGKIAKLLDRSTQRLDGRVVSALNRARNNALQRQSAYAYALAPASATARWTHWLAPHSAQQWIAAAVLVAAIISGAGYWHHTQEQQISELDVAILTDELPIEVFVD
jgi:hypothetical protein